MYRYNLGGLSEDQIKELATFARNLLEETGVAEAIKELNEDITALAIDETEDSNKRILLLSEIQGAYIDLHNRASRTGKTVYGLTGVKFDGNLGIELDSGEEVEL